MSIRIRSAGRAGLVAAAMIAWMARPGSAQTGTIRGVVVAALGGVPLPYSDVTLLGDGSRRFANDSGVFTIVEVPAGPAQIRVRRLGYTPRTVTVNVAADATTRMRVELTHLTIQLTTVRTEADWRCLAPGPPDAAADSVLWMVFDQLRQNADRYELLMREYPTVATYEITNGVVRGTRVQATISEQTARVESTARWDYAPGRVVRARGTNGAMVNVPTLDVFAQDRFIGAHCFRNAGLEPVDGDTLLRVDFRAADRIHDPDLSGSLYLDPRSYLIIRSVLQLTEADRVLTRGDSAFITTRFDELLPGVPFVADIVSRVHLRPTDDSAAAVANEEERRRIRVEFTGKRPPDARIADVAPVVAPFSARPPEVARILGVFDEETGEPIDDVLVTDSITGRARRTSPTGTMRLDFISRLGGVLTMVKQGYDTASLRVSAAPADTVGVTAVLRRRHPN